MASENRLLRRAMERSRAGRIVTRRFVAGNTLQEAVDAVQTLQTQRMLSSLDNLGESVSNNEEAAAATDAYLESVGAIAHSRLPASVSLKLTQLGLDLSTELCRQNLMRIVRQATPAGIRVEVDMEASPYVERTLDLVEEAHRAGGLVRAVIQAYLHRSEADIHRLNRAEIPVRLCKGAYKEGPGVAIVQKPDVDANFQRLASVLLREGVQAAIASHDEAMIQSALQVVSAHNIPPTQFEFQMLYGIGRHLQQRLAQQGYAVRIYIPYGQAWYPYLMRRMAERPANLLFIARNLLR
ncbi:MAG: proline dehydrogenase family protein [Bryobacterales bacterium]|nr:proline dehydrogenase family protein [Bryobacterales bacterium]